MTFAGAPSDPDWHEFDVSLDMRYRGVSVGVGAIGSLGRDGRDDAGLQARVSARF